MTGPIPTQERLIIPSTMPLEEVSAWPIGGKARNLFRLRAAGFEVPDWWVISSRVFDSAVEPQRPEILALLKGVESSDVDNISRTSDKLGKIIKQLSPPRDLIEELHTILTANGHESRFAVRSSVLDEDSTSHSFAGLMESFLNRDLDQLSDSIVQVWRSAYSSRALSYRISKHIDVRNISAAVIIQKMVAAKCGGVLFTHDPKEMQEVCVITAARGLGEGVTSDFADTDTYRSRWQSDAVECEIDGEWTHSIIWPDSILSSAEIRQLKSHAIRACSVFGMPLDMEWAFDQQGKCWILQARPIIAPQALGRLRIWDNANIIESYPGLTLPLSFSFARDHYERTFRQLALSAFRLRPSYWHQHPVFKQLFGLINGRVYLNLLSWYQMLSFLPGFKRHKAAWDHMFGIQVQLEIYPSHVMAIDYLGALALMTKALLSVAGGRREFDNWFEPLYQRYAVIDLTALNEDELLAKYEELSTLISQRWHLTLRNDFCAMTYYEWLKTLCQRWAPGSGPNLHNDLLRGQTLVESVAPSRSIDVLADMFSRHPAFTEISPPLDNEAIWHRILSDDRCIELKTALHLHIEKFGDRCVEELKLEVPGFREQPDRLIGIILERIKSGSSITEIESQASQAREVSERRLHSALRNPLKHAMLRYVMRNARRSLANRESMRLARARLYGLVRRIFRQMATRLVAKHLISSQEDIFYLTVGEITDLINGASPTRDLNALTNLRRADYAQFALEEPPSRFVTYGLQSHPLSQMASPTDASGNTAVGTGCSTGIASGKARIIHDPATAKVENGDIIVAHSTDPAWVYLMTACRAIVVERGSTLSHTSIIGRELGIPTVVGVQNATRRIPDGSIVTVDGETGKIKWE